MLFYYFIRTVSLAGKKPPSSFRWGVVGANKANISASSEACSPNRLSVVSRTHGQAAKGCPNHAERTKPHCQEIQRADWDPDSLRAVGSTTKAPFGRDTVVHVLMEEWERTRQEELDSKFGREYIWYLMYRSIGHFFYNVFQSVFSTQFINAGRLGLCYSRTAFGTA